MAFGPVQEAFHSFPQEPLSPAQDPNLWLPETACNFHVGKPLGHQENRSRAEGDANAAAGQATKLEPFFGRGVDNANGGRARRPSAWMSLHEPKVA